MFSQRVVVDLLLDRLKPLFEMLLRSQRDFALYRDQLQQHIHDPKKPEDVQDVDLLKERQTVQDIHCLRVERVDSQT